MNEDLPGNLVPNWVKMIKDLLTFPSQLPRRVCQFLYLKVSLLRSSWTGAPNLEKNIITPEHSFSAPNNIGGAQKSISFHHFWNDCQETLLQNSIACRMAKSHPHIHSQTANDNFVSKTWRGSWLKSFEGCILLNPFVLVLASHFLRSGGHDVATHRLLPFSLSNC